MQRFFIETTLAHTDKFYTYSGPDFKHIVQVLRMQIGDSLILIDEAKSRYTCEIVSILDKSIDLKILNVNLQDTELPYELWLHQGFVRSSKLELVIQKGVELGLTHFQPFFADFSNVKIKKEDVNKKKIRWEKIVESAAKQSSRSIIPKVIDIDYLENILKEIAKKEDALCIVPWECEDGYTLKSLLVGLQHIPKSIHVFIGPEGGFSTREIELFKHFDAKTISLGPRILRTETAGICTLAQINYELESD